MKLPFVILFTIGCFCAAAMGWQQWAGALIWPPQVTIQRDNSLRDWQRLPSYTTENRLLTFSHEQWHRPGWLLHLEDRQG